MVDAVSVFTPGMDRPARCAHVYDHSWPFSDEAPRIVGLSPSVTSRFFPIPFLLWANRLPSHLQALASVQLTPTAGCQAYWGRGSSQ